MPAPHTPRVGLAQCGSGVITVRAIAKRDNGLHLVASIFAYAVHGVAVSEWRAVKTTVSFHVFSHLKNNPEITPGYLLTTEDTALLCVPEIPGQSSSAVRVPGLSTFHPAGLCI